MLWQGLIGPVGRISQIAGILVSQGKANQPFLGLIAPQLGPLFDLGSPDPHALQFSQFSITPYKVS